MEACAAANDDLRILLLYFSLELNFTQKVSSITLLKFSSPLGWYMPLLAP